MYFIKKNKGQENTCIAFARAWLASIRADCWFISSFKEAWVVSCQTQIVASAPPLAINSAWDPACINSSQNLGLFSRDQILGKQIFNCNSSLRTCASNIGFYSLWHLNRKIPYPQDKNIQVWKSSISHLLDKTYMFVKWISVLEENT